MILATVTTCPQRWAQYQRLRQNYGRLELPFPLRTFQTSEHQNDPRQNNNLNARAALAYCLKHFADVQGGWVLYLEDDLLLQHALKDFLEQATDRRFLNQAECWYLCNRKVDYRAQFQVGPYTVNELAYPVKGTHALLLSGRILPELLNETWLDYADRVLFRVLNRLGIRVLQVVDPVLAVHVGAFSTFAPHRKTPLEINHANPCYSH